MAAASAAREPGLSRRALLAGAGALATLAAGSARTSWAAAEHDHAKHAPRNPELLEALEACTAKGRRCMSHCLAAFDEGDTSLSACAQRVYEMLAVCGSLEPLVAGNSRYVKGMAAVCADVCRDCAEECRQHAEKHLECRECMEACERLLPLLERLGT